jgi:hypothetical protein
VSPILIIQYFICVPDHVKPGLVRRTIDLGWWEFGTGREGGGDGEGRSVYEQPGTKMDSIASRQRRVSK